MNFLDERIALSDDPRSIGQALSGPLRRYWRYRVGDYRLICDLQDGKLVVLVLEIGNRRDIYR
jgi:mRNA interferase RelE/StbE